MMDISGEKILPPRPSSERGATEHSWQPQAFEKPETEKYFGESYWFHFPWGEVKKVTHAERRKLLEEWRQS